ncbi:MAG: cell surface protein SprA [Bacteroidota bacterium]
MNLKGTFTYHFIITYFILLLASQISTGQSRPPQNESVKNDDQIQVNDTIPPLHYDFKFDQKGGLFLKDPTKYEVIYDPETGHYIFYEKIGDYLIKHPSFMTEDEYKQYRTQRDMLEYSKDKLGAIGGKREGSKEAQKNLLPTYYVNSNFFESIFGGNEIEVNPQGSVLIKMGLIHQNVENPQLSERNRTSTTFDFDQEISASLNARVGKRLKVNANFDTQSTFNFQNQVKIEYTPTEDDIIRKLEIGNVSMSSRNSLVTGVQNLIGAKAELQFGKTTVTGIFSQQRSQTKTVSAQGGSLVNEFEIRASDYDPKRHYFLAHTFVGNYENALANFPLINSAYNITRIEVWVTNRNSTTENTRNIVALADLGENDQNNIGPANISPNPGAQDASNDANTLNNLLTPNGAIRDIATVNSALMPYNMQQGRDFTILENAKKLIQGIDFTFNASLGFIHLNKRLQESDVLAVAFEYTDGSNVYQVGELSGDGIVAPDNLVVKLLQSEIINTSIPMWDLMMKNVYEIPGAFQLSRNDFRLEIMYHDDNTGVPVNILQNAQTPDANDKTLLNLMSLDRLDSNNNVLPEGDGFFDYVEGITIDSKQGYFIFPTVEPFGNDLDDILDPTDDNFVFKELYDRTQSEAQNDFQNKDKYIFKGYFKSDGQSGIPLGAFNVPRGSVKVTSGGRELLEGVDYVVDYNIGNVQIIDPTLLSSNAPIQVQVENNIGFTQQRRRYMGVDVQHVFNEHLAIGGNIINLNEKPLTQKAQYGVEPVNNTIIGFHGNYSNEVPLLTKLVNKLPNIDTDAKSFVSVRAEVAHLLPGSPKGIDLEGTATSYIDDFEGSQIPIDIRSPKQWYLASTPQGQTGDLNFNNGNLAAGLPDELRPGSKRSKLSWYNIDQIFYGTTLKPGNIDNDELSRAEVRRVTYQELFPEVDLDITQTSIVRTFDLAYFPQERGSYNFDDSFNTDGKYINPEDRWGGIMRSLTTTNFQQANIEYIQFWILDPYENYSIKPEEGGSATPPSPADFKGDLYFNLGSISEDILLDNRKMFENGLPKDGIQVDGDNVEFTPWSSIPKKQSLIYTFDEDDTARQNQDLGFDGINDSDEAIRFGSSFGDDPANDNFHYFRGSDLDGEDASIITRYRDFNLTEGNSSTPNNSPENYPTAATSYPDVEDINKDQTMSAIESYYQYKVSLNQSDLVVGKNNIVDKREVTVKLANNSTQKATWYQFRIPITIPEDPNNIINNMSGFTSIRFLRMFLTNFKIPVVLRFGELELVRGDWRRYTKTLDDAIDPPQEISPAENQKFEVGVVNIEENEDRQPIPYVLPPGIKRERLQGTTSIQQQNEQSISVKVSDLDPGQTRSVFKNTSFDMRMYQRLKMFIHAESILGQTEVNDNELLAVIRLGSDTDENYYQLEVPLKITGFSAATADEIWPEANNLNAKLQELSQLKLDRIDEGFPINEVYPKPQSGEPAEFRIRVKGNPNLANLRTIMLGVKNISSTSKSTELWFNELRVSDFDNEGGYAAVLNADVNLADFADLSLSGAMHTKGFGSIDQRVNERSQEDVKQYGIITNVNFGQLLPKKVSINLPLNFSFSEEFRDPKYDPQYQDVLFDEGNTNSDIARDYTKRSSFNLLNVKLNKTEFSKKAHFYDPENLSVSYSFNELYHRNYNIQKYLDQQLRASANYSYSFKPMSVEPLKNWSLLSDKEYLRFLKEINMNLFPNTFSVNSNIIRSYNEQLSRSLVASLPDLPTLVQRDYMFNWDYLIGWNLTKSFQFTFRALNNYVYDEFENGEDILLYDNFFNIGRPEHYHQTFEATYKLPFDKFKYLDFINATYSYTADFDWQAPSYSNINVVGNTIQNANTHNFTADLAMDRLYKQLGTDYWFKTKKDKAKDKESKSENKEQKKQKIPDDKLTAGQKIGRVGVDILTSVKNIKVSYTENNGTFLPGFIPEMGLLGRSSYNGGLAPTFGFVFGSQTNILNKALENGWLLSRDIDESIYSKNYNKSHFEKFDYTVIVKPGKYLDIELFGNRTFTESFSQQLDVVNDTFNNSPENALGNFSISYFMLKSTFEKEENVFREFEKNREIIANRLADRTGGEISGFGPTNQDVVLPAFLAAYSGTDANSVELDAFRDTPIPNWRLTYKGLMNIGWFKNNFRNFTLEHSYRSMYSILSFSNNLKYDEDNPYGSGNIDVSGNFNPEQLYNGVSLIEEFAPFAKVDFRMKNSFSLRAAYNKDRALNLNFNNNTVTEISGNEIVIGLGYRIKDVKMQFKTGNKKTKFQGDINLKADLGVRDNLTTIRSYGITDNINNDQITGGQNLVSFKFLADYALNKNMLASFYFDYNKSKFAISTTYPRTSINGGISLRYIIGN